MPKYEGHGFFCHQGSDMSENISLKIGAKFAVSLNMDKTLFSSSYNYIHRAVGRLLKRGGGVNREKAAFSPKGGIVQPEGLLT